MAKKKATPKTFATHITTPTGERVYLRAKTKEELEEKVLQARMELRAGVNISQDIPFYSDWGKSSFKKFEAIRSFDNITGFTHIFESVLPKLKARGVSEDEIHTLLVKNPARVFHGGYTY